MILVKRSEQQAMSPRKPDGYIQRDDKVLYVEDLNSLSGGLRRRGIGWILASH